MAHFQVFKETALPGALVANAIYLITAANANHVEMYVTDNAGSATRRIPTEADINILINAAVSAANALQVVADIAARNALAPTTNTQVLVLDASADGTVASGAATYIWDQGNTAWVKISEAESMDVSLTWASITGKPASTPAQIDATVAASHSHANKTQLDKITEDGDGCMLYDTKAVAMTGSLNW